MSKRKRPFNTDNNDNNNKKNKQNNFISASHLKNYILNDPIIDYLSYWNIKTIDDKPDKTKIKEKTSSGFLDYLCEKGIEFENNVYEYLKNNFNVVQVYKNPIDLNESNYELTKNYIKQGIQIIYQGVLYNYDNDTYGIPDLLIRSDYINNVFPNIIEKNYELINNKYYYFVIDIKNSTINLDKTGKYVLNSNNLPFYKTQILLYTIAISKILNITITKGFILGRRYNYGNLTYTNYNYQKLGEINYKEIDNIYYKKLEDSINWIKRVRNEGINWKILPKPTVTELYPNMKNNKDFGWRPIKKIFSNQLNEITEIWNVSVKHRNIAHSNKIYSWKNKRCNSENLGITSKIATIIDKIININRSTSKKNLILPKKINYNDNQWKSCSNNTLEFYIDYETLNYNDTTYIYMIGVGYYFDGWKFKNFILKNLSQSHCIIMFNEFWNYINDTLKLTNKVYSQFIHWTKAEPSQYNKYVEKLMLPNKNFIDLFEVFKNEPVVVKGAMNFSLKEIANALYDLNLIDTSWNVSSSNNSNLICQNGQDALYMGIKLYEELDNDEELSDNNLILKEISQYNEVDCKVLYEIITLLRETYI